MKKLRPLSLTILMALIVFVLFTISGIVDRFEQSLLDKGWKKTGAFSYSKTESKMHTYVSFSILKDPEFNENFRVIQGVIKKSALDRMDYLGDETLNYKGVKNIEDDSFEDDLKLVCKHKGGNTIVINNIGNKMSTVHTKFGIQ